GSLPKFMSADNNGLTNSYGIEAAGPHVFFSADDGVTGRQLWMTDGTANGTLPVHKTNWSPRVPGVGVPGNPEVFADDGVGNQTVIMRNSSWAPTAYGKATNLVFYSGSDTSVVPAQITNSGTTTGFGYQI